MACLFERDDFAAEIWKRRISCMGGGKRGLWSENRKYKVLDSKGLKYLRKREYASVAVAWWMREINCERRQGLYKNVYTLIPLHS